jgi:hypothetical protein
MVGRRNSDDAGEFDFRTHLIGGHMTIAVLIVVFFVLLAALMWSRRGRRRA